MLKRHQFFSGGLLDQGETDAGRGYTVRLWVLVPGVRHPQYSGLFLIILGLLIQWPTIITALMSPVLFYVYYRLAKHEEAEMETQFGGPYRQYRSRTRMFIPKFGGV